MAELIVIGIGNPYRGDDGVGWIVVDQLKEKLNSSINLSKQRGDIGELLDAFSKHKIVFLIDACNPNTFKNPWKRIDCNQGALEIESHQTSTHGLNISQAIALAKILDQLPKKLIIYAIAGHCYQMCETLSPSVERAAREVVKAILNEEDVLICMNKV